MVGKRITGSAVVGLFLFGYASATAKALGLYSIQRGGEYLETLLVQRISTAIILAGVAIGCGIVLAGAIIARAMRRQPRRA